jgi:hypothetical protein
MPYVDGEVLLALTRYLGHQPPPERAEGLQRLAAGFEAQVAAASATLASSWFMLEEHWTCLAAAEAAPLLPPSLVTRLATHCEAYCDFIGRFQVGLDAADPLGAAMPDLIGTYLVTPLVAPHFAPLAARTEAVLATLELVRRVGRPRERVARLERQAHLGLTQLVAAQLGADAERWVPRPTRTRGSLLRSPVSRVVRIDYVQHAGAAFLRASRGPGL